ncbi:MAG: AraC family transcriptional regulator [Pseudomonadota bacterium]
MKFNSIKRKYFATLAAALFLVVTNLCASDHVYDDSGAVLTGDKAAEVEKRTLGATEGRAKAQESVNALSMEIQELKQSTIVLNKNLRILEEDLLFPANTQVSVFLSLDVGKFFTLDSVKLKLDGKIVSSHTYTEKELVALGRGGIHKLHMANLSIGDHSLSAFFTGTGPNGREYRRGTSQKINKQGGLKYIELKITDSKMKQQPEFTVAEW